MKVKQVFDGWELIPETPIDKTMVRRLWNLHHPQLQIKQIHPGAKLVVSTRVMERSAFHLIWTYCGEKNDTD